METFTKSIDLESLVPVLARSRWPLLRFLVELRRLSAVIGFAAGFIAILLYLKLSGIAALAQLEDGVRAYPNPAPNAMISATMAPATPAATHTMPIPRPQD